MESEVWPNPFSDHINMKVYFNSPGMATISMFDNAGNLVKQELRQVKAGQNDLLIDHLKTSLPGLFIIEVSKDNIKYRKKLIKNN